MTNDTDIQLALALSGGGHRATLYSLGACMALVDRGLNRKVVQVSSVSGGSILNAVLAQHRTSFSKMTPEEFDEVAQEVTTAVAQRAALSPRWIGTYLAGMLAGGVASVKAFSTGGVPRTLLPVVAGIGAGVPLLWFGHFVTWRLRRSFFPSSRGRTFGELPESEVEHVFCCSDLLTGYPVYVSTWNRGLLWRRTSDAGVIGGLPKTSGELWNGSGLTVAEVVRASAGFPGIPPRRIRAGGFRPDGSADKRVDRPETFGGRVPADSHYDDGAVMLLSDGGIINNLGTQVLKEDGFFQGAAGSVRRPAILAVNASSRLTARRHWPYYLPGLSLLSQLRRTLELLNSNSVVPRVASTRVALRRRAKAGTYQDPIELVIDLDETMDRLEVSLNAAIVDDRDTLRLRNPDYKRGQADMLDAIQKFFAESRSSAPSNDEQSRLIDELRRTWENLPWEIPPVSGILDHDGINDLTGKSWWGSLTDLGTALPDVRVPTTLGRLRPTVIRAIVLRGYLHAYLSSLALKPLAPSEPTLNSAGKSAATRIQVLGKVAHPE